MRGSKLLGLVLCFVFLLWFAAPVFAADPPMDAKRDLQGISPKRHRYIFTVLGGAAVGAGVGALVGSGNDITKGVLVGAGGASSIWLHSHHREGGALRPWEYFASHTALGAGIGWTICGCNDGLISGTLIGAGGDLLWQTMTPSGRRATSARGPNHP